MRILLLSAVAAATLSPVLAETSIPFPYPAPSPGVNTAAVPAPRLDWLNRVQGNFANSKKQPKIDLIFDGDSITDGWQGKGKAIWQEKYAPLNAFDFGISGDRTESVLWRLEQGQVDGLDPKLVAIMIGTNNLGANTAEQIADGIKDIVGQYQKRCPNAVILLQAIFPRNEKATDPARAKIKDINERIAKLADGKKVIFIDFGDKFLTADGTLTREVMPDLLHPSEQGYAIWADAIQPVIDKYFPKSH